jgi:hypothetical protein
MICVNVEDPNGSNEEYVDVLNGILSNVTTSPNDTKHVIASANAHVALLIWCVIVVSPLGWLYNYLLSFVIPFIS